MNRHGQIKITTPLFIGVVLVCFWFLPTTQAVSPAPDGGYTGNNTAEGTSALLSRTSGVNNTALGFEALKADTSGSYNTATGVRTLFSNTAGSYNTADGAFALALNTGNQNTATGYQALYHNNSSNNTADGFGALYRNTNGTNNTATGQQALYINTTGYYNTAVGSQALRNNVDGSYNCAFGEEALSANSHSSYNVAIGYSAGRSAHGRDNVFVGTSAGFDFGFVNTGESNVAVGNQAGSSLTTGNFNSFLGFGAGTNVTIGSSNVFLGPFAGSFAAGSGNVCIGAGVLGVAGESNTTRIANVYASTAAGRAVYVNSDNKIGTLSSSQRFKEEIKQMDKASETLLALKPVTFRYKKEIDPSGALSFGLIAEEVAQISPDLITRDAEGKPETVRYEVVNAMLLNEFLKAHRKIEEQGDMIAKQQKQIEALTAGLEKLTARLEASKSAPRVASNDSR